MSQVFTLWSSLDNRRRFFVIAAAVSVFAAVLGLSRLASSPNMALLYSGLDGQQAGEVIAALDQQNARYQIRGSAIFVEEQARDRLRMTLAGEGLPANTGSGYELLDQLSGFGTTTQMFDAAYWRAKEGELARTIVANPAIRNARVHISNPASSPFQRDVSPTASVTVTTAGSSLDAAQAQALRYLVSSAVAGLQPQDVAIIDAVSGRVITAEAGAETPSGDARARELKANVERLLAAHVGPGNAIVEVSVETVTERESVTERRFDPETRVAISTDTEERSSTATNSGGAPVTVASNLPAGDAAKDGQQSQNQESQLRERTNFEVSETKREILRVPGAIKRLTVAVLVAAPAGNSNAGGDSATRDEEELTALRDLVAAAVGFNAERGDLITLRSMPFQQLPDMGTGPSVGFAARYGLDAMRLIQLGVLSLVALALGLFVVRPILTGRREAPDFAARALPAGDIQLEGQAVEQKIGSAGQVNPASEMPRNALQAIPSPIHAAESSAPESLPDNPVDQLKRLIEDRQPDTIAILKSWLEDDTGKEIA